MRVKTGHALKTVIIHACEKKRPRHGECDHACENSQLTGEQSSKQSCSEQLTY